MTSNINWTANKMVESSPSRLDFQSISPAIPTQQNNSVINNPLLFQEGPPHSTEKGYIPYYLASNIGKNVRAEFILGSNQYTDRTGKLIEVGINYFVLEDVNSRTHVMCDLYSVKFVTILQI